MKKNILIILLLIPVLGFISACKKSSFDTRFNDPEKTTEGTIDAFYSGMFKNRRIIPDYYNLWTFVSTQLACYTQTIGVPNNLRMYEQPAGYTEDRWDDFYASPGENWASPLACFRQMERLYGELDLEADKEGYKLFMETGQIYMYDQATQMVDMWGDIPFSNAGLLNISGTLTLASYDEGKQVYDSALFHLKRISNWLATVQPAQFYLNKLAKQDILMKGDLNKWRRYANSLMLRLAMRISYVDENRARTLVQEILSNPTLYPLIESNADNVLIKTGPPNLVTNLVDAFNQNHCLAPDYMVDSLLEPSGDPRLRLLFGPNANGIYQGLPKNLNSALQDSMIGKRLVSLLDTVTFVENQSFPGIIFTASEVNFIRAEAYERWGGGSAKTYYDLGVSYSIDFLYNIHSTSQSAKPHETQPTQAEKTLLLQHPLVAYTANNRDENLNKIALQKWIAFGVMQNNQSWAEMRRSGYPRLWFRPDPTSVEVPLPQYRLFYPSKERNLNSFYKDVAARDKAYNKIFWMR